MVYAAPMALGGKRVLIAEDDFFVAQFVGDIVRDAGGTVVGPAFDAADALTLLGATDLPDCAVLDMRLRRSDASPIAAFLEGARVPFVMVTGYQREWLPPRLGKAPYLSKPFAPIELLDMLAMAGATRH